MPKKENKPFYENPVNPKPVFRPSGGFLFVILLILLASAVLLLFFASSQQKIVESWVVASFVLFALVVAVVTFGFLGSMGIVKTKRSQIVGASTGFIVVLGILLPFVPKESAVDIRGIILVDGVPPRVATIYLLDPELRRSDIKQHNKGQFEFSNVHGVGREVQFDIELPGYKEKILTYPYDPKKKIKIEISSADLEQEEPVIPTPTATPMPISVSPTFTPTPPVTFTDTPGSRCQINASQLSVEKKVIKINESIKVSIRADNPAGQALLFNWQAVYGQMDPGLRADSAQSIYTAPSKSVDDTISVEITMPGCTPVKRSQQIAVILPSVTPILSSTATPKPAPTPTSIPKPSPTLTPILTPTLAPRPTSTPEHPSPTPVPAVLDPDRGSGPNRTAKGATVILLNGKDPQGQVNYDEGDRTDWYQVNTPEKGIFTYNVRQHTPGTTLFVELYYSSKGYQAIEKKPLETFSLNGKDEDSFTLQDALPGIYYAKVFVDHAEDASSYEISNTLVVPGPTPTHPPDEEFRITQIVIKDAMGNLIVPKNGIYSIKLGETVTISVDFTNPHSHKIGVAWTARHGKVPPISEEENAYTAEKPGSDFVIVYVWDKVTGEELQEPINITVIP